MPSKDRGTARGRLWNLADRIRPGAGDTRPCHARPAGGAEADQAGVGESEGAEEGALGAGGGVSKAEEAQDCQEGSRRGISGGQ